MTTLIIQFHHSDVHTPKPWPVGVTDGIVTSGLGEDDGAHLVGFSRPQAYNIDVFYDDAIESPDSVVGLNPVFSDGEGLFTWDLPIEEMHVVGEA